jgi:hypothetical protein
MFTLCYDWHVSTSAPAAWTLAIRCALPLALGAGLYLLRTPASSALLMSGPGLLWMFATVSWMSWMWRRHPGREAVLWIAAATALGVGYEWAQAGGVIAGTFDPLDVAFNLAGAVLAMIVRAGTETPCADVAG